MDLILAGAMPVCLAYLAGTFQPALDPGFFLPTRSACLFGLPIWLECRCRAVASPAWQEGASVPRKLAKPLEASCLSGCLPWRHSVPGALFLALWRGLPEWLECLPGWPGPDHRLGAAPEPLAWRLAWNVFRGPWRAGPIRLDLLARIFGVAS